ncbi:MAG: SGNH/GDSL hydrolase family protein [Actinobacteria bacterium]|nr:MAG: SGNH/GDSL hydrolase family protein [Actinomycetota bacterium]
MSIRSSISAIVRSRARIACPLAVIAAALVAVPVAQAAPGPKHNPPKSVYLALGDSLAFGYQQAKFNQNLPIENPAVYNTGYVDDFAKDLGSINPRIQTVNLACPGETTDSLLGLTRCPYHPPFDLHTNYTGSQLHAALAILRAHPGRVSPVTVDIGANDVLALVRSCTTATGINLECVASGISATFAHIRANLSTILAKLRRAARHTEIIVLGYYNPLIVSVPGSDAVSAQLNSLVAHTAAQYRARFADPLPVFNPAVNEIPTICKLTLICTPLHDIHASDLGYQKLADLVFAASGY